MTIKAIVLDTGENADNRASLEDCSESDVTKIDGRVESLGLTGGVGNRSIPFSCISDWWLELNHCRKPSKSFLI